MKTIYLSLGSNVGDREQNITRAIAMMAERGIHIVRQSSLFETEPVGLRTQGWFLNCAVQAETDLMPRQLLHTIQHIEHELGRRRMVASGPRTIDIDILMLGTSVIHSAELDVPHPRMTERRFVLVPLLEIAPTSPPPRAEEKYHPIACCNARSERSSTSPLALISLGYGLSTVSPRPPSEYRRLPAPIGINLVRYSVSYLSDIMHAVETDALHK